jgi:hypothetical protein
MAKGGASENETCRQLSLWWSNGKTSALFRRTQMSGGKATVRARSKKKTPYEYGDITFSEPEAKPLIDFLLIENKSGYKDVINVLDFVDSPNKYPQLIKWWWKCESEKDLAKRCHCIIIFRRNRKSKCIMIQDALFFDLENECGSFEQDLIDIYYEKSHGEYRWFIISFDNFLAWVTPTTVRTLLRERSK